MHHNHLLSENNSFGIDVTASLFATPGTTEELASVIDQYDIENLPFLVVGEGSNILFKENFEGLVLKPSMKGIKLIEDEDSEVVVKVGAAENWDLWVEHAVTKGWYGLENLSLIPGSVGSAPVQNIGAYGVELKEHFEWLEAWDLQEKKTVRLEISDCRFGYRKSIFKSRERGRYIITYVAFRLSKEPQMKLDYGIVGKTFEEAGGATPMDLRNAIISIRESKLPDPGQYGNAGSFFKNPLVDRTIFKCIRVDHEDIPSYPESGNCVKIPAAWLIEKAGWKGKRIGNVGTWPSQPLVIVNYGGATGNEILKFSEQIRNAVDKQFGVYLDREVNVV